MLPLPFGEAAKKEMRMARCKQGDLAIVIREFDGCEENLGKLVWVAGNAPTKFSKILRLGTFWKIKPITASGWWACTYVSNGESGEASYSKNLSKLYHPDDWLFPFKAEPTATTATETTHTPKLEKV